MNVMRSFTLRSLRQNKKRTVVTILGVIISVAMITAVTTLGASFMHYLQQGTIADTGNWHAQLIDVPAGNVAAVTQSDIVGKAAVSREVGYAQIPDSQSYSKQYLCLYNYDAGGFDQMSIRLTEGRLPQQKGEVLISRSLLEGSGLDYAVGDTLTLDIGGITIDGVPFAGNGYLTDIYDDETGEVIISPVFSPRETMALTVVGVMEAPNFEMGYSAGYGLLGVFDPAALPPGDRVNVYVTISPLTRDVYAQVDGLMAGAGDPETGAVFNDELLRYYGVVEWDNVNTFMNGFMLVIILIIVVASISLIYNAFAISVSERARQLGLLASVGATRRQKRASVYFEGLFVGAIGIPLGIAAGLGGIAVTLAAIQPLLDSFINMPENVKLTLVAPISAIGLAVLFSVVTIFVSVYRPARRASKIMPIDAIRQTQEVRLTRKSVRTSRITRALFGFEAEIALKNLKRSRKKYRATVVSLVISLVLFLTVSSYADITGSLANAVNDGYNYDLFVQYSDPSDGQVEDANSRIAALDLTDSFTASTKLVGYARLSAGQLSDLARDYVMGADSTDQQADIMIDLVALDDASFDAYAQAAGVRAADFADVQNPRAILINYGMAYAAAQGNDIKKVAGDILLMRTGDTLTFTPGVPESDIRDADTTLIIGAVTQQRPMGVLTGSFSTATLVTTDAVMDSLMGSLSAADFQLLQSNSALRGYAHMTTGRDQQLEAQVNELLQTLPSSGYYIVNIKDMARGEQNLSTFLGVFVYGFIILITLICIANIFNTVSTNIALRRRELAMLRSVGMTPGSFNRMVRFESVFYGLKGLLWGLPISLLIALLLYNMQTDILGMSFSLPYLSYGFAVLMILVIVFASMVYATHRVKKENIIDALKEENV